MKTTRLAILLVEDNPADSRIIREFLQEIGSSFWAITPMPTLAEALASLKQRRFDLIVLDLTLPDAEGLEGLQQITAARPDIPIVVHSGLDDRDLIIEAVKHGAQDYLVKGQYDTLLLERVLRYAMERQQTLREVQESEMQLRALFEQTSDGIVIVERNGHVLFANPAAERLLNTPTEDLMETPFGFPLVVDETTELDIAGPQGQSATVEMRVTPISWKRQEAYLAALRDITAHRQLQEQLIAAKENAEALARLKSSFLASMSHELRTPLTGIMGFADTLIHEVANAQHRKFAGIIKEAGERLLATINSVLDLSQLEAGTIKVKKKPIRLKPLVQETLVLLDPLAKQKGLMLSLAPHASDAVVHGDYILLQRILNNLIGNAIKFTDRGSVIVEIDTDDTHMHLRVIDSGPGIDPSFMPHLFEQFTQENSGLRRSHPGSGLGLAITKKLVALLNGAISVVSEIGVGSTFTVSLPSVQDTGPLKMVSRQPQRPSSPQDHPRLLAAEDREETRAWFKYILNPHFNVTLVADAETALDLLQSHTFDVLLLDLQLAGPQTALDLLAFVRTTPAHRETPIVAVTALGLPGDQSSYLEQLGFDGYLRKPLTADQLLHTLHKAIEDRRTGPFPRSTRPARRQTAP